MFSRNEVMKGCTEQLLQLMIQCGVLLLMMIECADTKKADG